MWDGVVSLSEIFLKLSVMLIKTYICFAKKIDMNFESDFSTVNLILSSKFETRGVDAFALSLIKAEKQLRRIFTFLIYQNPVYATSNISELRDVLAKNKDIYFRHFVVGINDILPLELKDIYGNDYEKDLKLLLLYTKDRNKIFHGQITLGRLSRSDLIDRVDHIKKWCMNLGTAISLEIGFDGFSKSYVKSTSNLYLKNLDKFDSISNYESFLTRISKK